MHASLDRTEVSQEESVSLKLTTDNAGLSAFEPQFNAPDFETINQFESSSFSSNYINGKFESKNEKTITYILRPLKVGLLKISKIRNLGNQETAPDLSVRVISEPATQRKGVEGTAPSLKGDAKNFFVKAEISNSKPFVGEQIVVSYYLYRRTKANVREVMQYPSFQGFIREDLEMPILSGRNLDYEAVSLGGIPFERALLARYAIYPIKTGPLKIDGLNIRADYIPKESNNEDVFDDPFFQFFSQVTPRTATSKSDPINVEVQSLPESGKTQLFTGGVGRFEVHATLDTSEVKAGNSVTLKITIRGKGNTNLIELPKISWPPQVKFFESQGRSQNLGQGVTEKTFDVVFIPLEKGELPIPKITFEFFNPETKSYQQVLTPALSLKVTEGDEQTIAQIKNSAASSSPVTHQESTTPALHEYGKIRMPDPKNADSGVYLGQPWWRYVGWGSFLIIFSLVALLIWDEFIKKSTNKIALLKKKQDVHSFWDSKANQVETLISSATNVEDFVDVMEEVTQLVFNALDQSFHISSKSSSRRELVTILTQSHKVNDSWIEKISQTLEFSELVRFVSSGNVLSIEQIRKKIPQWLQDAKSIVIEFSKKS